LINIAYKGTKEKLLRWLEFSADSLIRLSRRGLKLGLAGTDVIRD
jgi:hypothetical protein